MKKFIIDGSFKDVAIGCGIVEIDQHGFVHTYSDVTI